MEKESERDLEWSDDGYEEEAHAEIVAEPIQPDDGQVPSLGFES